MSAALLTPPDSEPSTPPYEDKPEYITPSAVPSAASNKNAANDLQAAASYPTRKGYKHSLLSLTDSLTSVVLSSVTSFSYGPVVAACRSAILGLMAHSITYGRLRILTLPPIGSTSGDVYVFPSYEKKPKQDGEDVVDIRVLSDTFWLRLVTLGDLGFAEAYMAGDCEVSDLVQVFQIFIRSRPALNSSSNISGVSTIPSRIFSVVTSLTNSRFANTLSNSLSNIRAHYDLSNGMFSAFLSRDMMYSCAIFPELDKDMRGTGSSAQLGQREQVNGGMGLKRIANGQAKASKKANGHAEANGQKEERDELEDAQMAKLRHIIKKADIRPGHRVLEIGSGWGAFAIEAVRTTNCTVDTITLSSQQKALAEERIKKAGLSGRIRVWLMDYRNLPESWMGAFDRVVSIEMLEAVGKEFIQGYFSVLDKVLNERGVACIQVITIPESRFEKYQQEVDFIRKWIFPGGFLPTVSYVTECVQKGAQNKLVIDSVSNIGPHYARTLREWRRRFLKTFTSQTEPAMRAEHPEMTDADIEVFKRKWIYYFCYCEVGFSERVLGDHIFTMVREGNADYGCTTYD